jgi:hypothetical protein
LTSGVTPSQGERGDRINGKKEEVRKMFNKKRIWFVPMFMTVLWCCVITSPVYSGDGSVESRLLRHTGKSYGDTQDPTYLTYDLALREYMVDRINKRFGVVLDPKTYSGFDLLEIESFFKYKKSDEPFDMFLKMFPKYP